MGLHILPITHPACEVWDASGKKKDPTLRKQRPSAKQLGLQIPCAGNRPMGTSTSITEVWALKYWYGSPFQARVSAVTVQVLRSLLRIVGACRRIDIGFFLGVTFGSLRHSLFGIHALRAHKNY